MTQRKSLRGSCRDSSSALPCPMARMGIRLPLPAAEAVEGLRVAPGLHDPAEELARILPGQLVGPALLDGEDVHQASAHAGVVQDAAVLVRLEPVPAFEAAPLQILRG